VPQSAKARPFATGSTTNIEHFRALCKLADEIGSIAAQNVWLRLAGGLVELRGIEPLISAVRLHRIQLFFAVSGQLRSAEMGF